MLFENFLFIEIDPKLVKVVPHNVHIVYFHLMFN